MTQYVFVTLYEPGRARHVHIAPSDGVRKSSLCGRTPTITADDNYGWHLVRVISPGKPLTETKTDDLNVCFQCETIYERNVRSDQHIHGQWLPEHPLPDKPW